MVGIVIIFLLGYFGYHYHLANSKQGRKFSSCSSLPSNGIISKPGCYELNKDYFVQNKKIAVKIKSNDVYLNLNEHKIVSKDSKLHNLGISCQDYKHISVVNGAVEGFYNGAYFTSCEDIRVSKLRFANIRNMGIVLSAVTNASINGNIISFDKSYIKLDRINFYFIGISSVAGKWVSIGNNLIYQINPSRENKMLEQVGILLTSNNNNFHIHNNLIQGKSWHINGYGIWIGNVNNIIHVDNNIIRSQQEGIVVATYNKNIEITQNVLSHHKNAIFIGDKSAPVKIIDNTLIDQNLAISHAQFNPPPYMRDNKIIK